MEEYRSFDYDVVNLPIRVFLSHFIALSRDKLSRPEFFCWSGMYLSGQREMPNVRDIWLRHLSLFSDRGDRNGVIPAYGPTALKTL
jgi:hypothetical protein